MQVNEILHQVPFFNALSESDIEFVVSKLEFKTYAKNQAICRINEPGDKMFIIISGNVRICIYDADGNEQEVAQLTAGNYFGEMALLTDEPRTATVYTTESSEMFILNKKEFDEILDEFPSIQIELGKIMSRRLRQNLAKAMEMSKKAAQRNIEQKTASGKIGPEKTIVDIMGFCDSKSLTGDIEINSAGRKGIISYNGGQIIKVICGSVTDDEALDELLTWEEGTFTIKPKEISFDELVGSAESQEQSNLALVVSNSLVVRKLLERKLGEKGYSVKSAQNIASASNLLQTDKPKVVVADTKFDDGNVLELGKKVVESSNCPMVIISDGKVPDDVKAFIAKNGKSKISNSHDINEVIQLVSSIG